tara:strand:+ start:10942 stop:14421 length:3480 start_codon:yes stop_codon:yes gene_type:complete
MGNFLDKLFNGPPFGPECVPECTDSPRGSRCYKGQCVPECPMYSKFVNGTCVCQSGLNYSSVNIPNKTINDGWGQCTGEVKILSEEDLNEKGLIFPEDYNPIYKTQIMNAYSSNPDMTKDEFNKLTTLIEQSFKDSVKERCPKENEIINTILSDKYGKGNWVDNPLSVNIPWESSIETWPNREKLVECNSITKLHNTIRDNNVPTYGEEYQKVVEGCNSECKKKVSKSIQKEANKDFPLNEQEQQVNTKEIDCTDECNVDCEYKIETTTLGECSKNCNDGNGPGEQSVSLKITKEALGSGKCPIKNAKKGETYLTEMKCNNFDCPKCEVIKKEPYYDDTVDYRGFTNNGTIYQKCLKEGQEIDCDGGKGDRHYIDGARTKYTVSYLEKSNDKGKVCVPGPYVVSEPCKEYAEDLAGNKIKQESINKKISNSELEKNPHLLYVPGGGRKCNNECIYSDNHEEIVKECNATCGVGDEERKKFVIGDKSANVCPEPEPVSFKCAETPCDADCVLAGGGQYYQDGENTCPGVLGGPYPNVTWDDVKKEWSDGQQHVRKLKQVSLIPARGTGTCDLKTKEENCPTSNVIKPLDCKYGPWEFERIQGMGTTVSTVRYPNVNHKNLGKHCIKKENLKNRGSLNPMQVFRREIEQEATYGGNACLGFPEKKEDYLTEDGNECPQNQKFAGSWSDLTWNQVNCKEKYTEQEIKDEYEKNFDLNKDWPKKDQIKGPGNVKYYEYKKRTTVGEAKYGGFESGDWYSLKDKTTTEEKYPPITDFREKKYRLCKPLSDIKYPNKGWNLHENVIKKDCTPVYKKEDKLYSSKKVIFSNNTTDIEMKPKIGEESYIHDIKNEPKFPHGYLTSGNFTTSKHDGDKSTFNPNLDDDDYWKCPGKGHWLQFETLSNNIELIGGIILTDNINVDVQYSRNKSSWSANVQLFSKNKGDQHLRIFGKPIEARYVRVYPSRKCKLKVGYLKKNDGVIDCKKGYSGRKTLWSKIVFDEGLTRKHGNWHEGNAIQKCPKDGTAYAVCLGKEEDCKDELLPSEFIGKKYSSDGVSAGELKENDFELPKDCGVDCKYGGWYSSRSEAAPNVWGPCVKNDGTPAKVSSDKGFQYQYKFMRTSPSKLSDDVKAGIPCFIDFDNKVANNFEELEAERSHRVKQECNRE